MDTLWLLSTFGLTNTTHRNMDIVVVIMPGTMSLLRIEWASERVIRFIFFWHIKRPRDIGDPLLTSSTSSTGILRVDRGMTTIWQRRATRITTLPLKAQHKARQRFSASNLLSIWARANSWGGRCGRQSAACADLTRPTATWAKTVEGFYFDTKSRVCSGYSSTGKRREEKIRQ